MSQGNWKNPKHDSTFVVAFVSLFGVWVLKKGIIIIIIDMIIIVVTSTFIIMIVILRGS